MSELAFERGQPWTQTIDTAFVREKCDLAAPPAIADILRERGKP